MSFNLHSTIFNKMFDGIAHLFKIFIHRTEKTYQYLDERILRLEQRPVVDEECVERILRKIIAEKFAGETFNDAESAMKPPTPSTRQISPRSDGVHSRASASQDTWLDGTMEFKGFQGSSPSDHPAFDMDDISIPSEQFKIDYDFCDRFLTSPALAARALADGHTPGSSRSHKSRIWE